MKRVFSVPNHIDFCITSRCNLRCKHCFASSQEEIATEPTTEDIYSLIDRLAEAKVFTITVTGGEPLMREDFFDILTYLKKYPFRVGLNTNAMLITEDISKRLSQVGLAMRISVSLDGSDKETHEKLRGAGTFEPALDGLRNLLRYNTAVRPFCVITRYNYRDLENIVRLSQSLGCRMIEFNSLMHGERVHCYQDLFLSPDEKKYVYATLLELDKRYEKYLGGSFLRMAKKARLLTTVFNEDLAKRPAGMLQNCDAGYGMAAVRADGKVTPCYTMLDYIVGDLHSDSLKEIWAHSAPLWEFRRMHDVSLDEIEPCNTCSYKSVCNAGCRASAYYSSGKLAAYDPEGCFRSLEKEAAL